MDRVERAVILVSGGVNSSVAASIREGYEPAFLHVRYPHRAAEREAECFRRLAAHLSVTETLVADLPHLNQIGGNARVDRQVPIEDASTLTRTAANTYIPGLMPAMLAAAFNWAHVIEATRIVVGVSENLGPPGPPTSTLYPDYRREIFQLYDELMALSRPELPPIRISTPLIDLDRTEIVQLGQRFDAPFHLTWSCYASDTTPCERCYGCATRAHGFIEASVADPLFSAPTT